MSQDLDNILNTVQKAAVEKTSGPCIILAGAGTGKSHTVIEKINFLVEKKIHPADEILCLTFSNEATNSLKRKVRDRIGGDVTVKTFHSFCSDVLREHGHLIGIDEGFEVLVPDDAKVFVHKYLGITPYWSGRYVSVIQMAKDFGIRLSDIEEYTDGILGALSKFHNTGSLDEYAERQRYRLSTLHLDPSDTKENRKAIRDEKRELKEFMSLYDEYRKFKDFTIAWKSYDELKKEGKYLDYSDLITFCLDLFNQYGGERVSENYSYVFVDEFQDTNRLQFDLIRHICKNNDITVVGDPNQSIYGFRGAYKESFDQFKKSFDVNDETDVFKLEKSYRSPDKVLDISHQLIQNNYEDPNECVHVKNAHNQAGQDVKIVELVNSKEEARYISEEVEKAIGEGVSPDQICILHRTHRMSAIIRRALESKNIPVITAGKTNLLQTEEIRTAIAYLGTLSNLIQRSGTGEQGWWDLFHYRNALSPPDSVKLGRYLKSKRKEEISIDEALLSARKEIGLSPSGEKTVEWVVEGLKKCMKASRKSLPDLILDIYGISGLNRAFTYERSARNIEALMNLRKFHEMADQFYQKHGKTVPQFIEYVEMMDSLGVEIEAEKIRHIDAVRLMTFHAVKGLEYELVIVSNMAKDRFPISRTQTESLIPNHMLPDYQIELEKLGDANEKEREKHLKKYEKNKLLYDERRLCYVAWTRAKKSLTITYARSYNNEADSTQQSPFLDEIRYRENTSCEYSKDYGETSTLLAPSSYAERYKSLLKDQLIKSLDRDNLSEIVARTISYLAARDQKPIDLNELSKVRIGEKDQIIHINKSKERLSGLKFDPKDYSFSPTSLIEYDSCPKKFELKNLLQMPERGDFDAGGTSTTMGSFIHRVLEDGVKDRFKTLEEYIKHSKELMKSPEYPKIDEKEAEHLINVFWARNRRKYGENSKTEIKLTHELGGYRFFGVADRVDELEDGTYELIDYKTNSKPLEPKKRAWQLGFYTLALQAAGYTVSKLTLEMLRLEKPYELTLDSEGNATAPGNTKGFNLNEVRQELIETCKKIEHDFEHEFTPTEEENCRFCGYKFYCPRWGGE